MGLVSFFEHLGHDIKLVAIKVSDAFSRLFGTQASETFGKAALALLQTALGQIAVAEVEALMGATDLSGIQKAATAQLAILAKAEQLGISTAVSIINLLIELSYQFLKGNLTAIAPDSLSTEPDPGDESANPSAGA